MHLDVDCAGAQWLYVRTNTAIPGDIKTFDFGRLWYSCYGAVNTNICGELWIEADLELAYPVSLSDASLVKAPGNFNTSAFTFVQNAGVSTVSGIYTTYLPANGTLFMDLDGLRIAGSIPPVNPIAFSISTPGNYFIYIEDYAAVFAGTAILTAHSVDLQKNGASTGAGGLAPTISCASTGNVFGMYNHTINATVYGIASKPTDLYQPFKLISCIGGGSPNMNIVLRVIVMSR